jgi:flagellin-like protein
MRDKKKRAVSPVIATVILVAVAITIAVAVSYWMGGISSQYTRFEKVEVTSAYCEYVDDLDVYNSSCWTDQPGWIITMDFRNTGTTDATIIDVFVNSKKWDAYGTNGETIDFELITGWEVFAIITVPHPQNTQLFVPWNEKLTCDPGTEDTLYVVIQDHADITFTAGTTVEVAIHTGAGNTYMKMVTLS